jgi:hypothetical protein
MINLKYFFSKWGSPTLCIEEMHTTFFYFIIQQRLAKHLNNHIDWSHQTQVSKHHQTSTILEEKTRPYGSATANVDSWKNPKKAPCAHTSSIPPPLSPRTHLQGVRPKRSLSPDLPTMPPQRKVPPPCARNTTRRSEPKLSHQRNQRETHWNILSCLYNWIFFFGSSIDKWKKITSSKPKKNSQHVNWTWTNFFH